MNEALVKPKVLTVVGATASGKSSLAVKLARTHDGEVISADSRQIYKGLDASTGKITPEEMQGVPHHMLDIAHPSETISVAEYKHAAMEAIADILDRNKLPIICGGTGLYIDALLYNLEFPHVPPNHELRAQLSGKSTEELCGLIKARDEQLLRTIDTNNPRRLMRALEILEVHSSIPTQEKIPQFDALLIGLNTDFAKLKEKVKLRIEHMLRDGMADEVAEVSKTVSADRLSELGFDFTIVKDLIDNKITHDKAIELLINAHYQYAKRQMTWFKRNKSILWFDPKDTSKIEIAVDQFLDK